MKDWLNSWIKWCAIGAFEQNMKIYIWLKSPNIIEKFFSIIFLDQMGCGWRSSSHTPGTAAGHHHLVNHLVSWTQSPGQPLGPSFGQNHLDTSTLSVGHNHLVSNHSNLVHQLDIHLVNHLVTWSPGHHLINYLVRYTHPPCHQDTTTWTTTLSPSHLDTTTLPTILSTMAMTMNFDEDQQKEN